MCISLRVCACVIQHDLLMHVNNVVVYLAILLCLNSLQRGMSTTIRTFKNRYSVVKGYFRLKAVGKPLFQKT